MAAVSIATNAPKSGKTPWRPYFYKPKYLGTHTLERLRSDGVQYIDQITGDLTSSSFLARCKDVHNLGYSYKIQVKTDGSDDTLLITKCSDDGTSVEGLGAYGTTGADLEWEFSAHRWFTIDIGVDIRFSDVNDVVDGDVFWVRLPTIQEMEVRRTYTAYSTWVRVPSVEGTSFKSGNIPMFLKQKDLMVQLNPTLIDTDRPSVDGEIDITFPHTYYSYAEDLTGANPGVNLFMEWNLNKDGTTDDAAATSTGFAWPSATESWMLGTLLLNDRDDTLPFFAPVEIPYDDSTAASGDTGTTQTGNTDIAQRAGYGRFRLDVYSDAGSTTARFADNMWWQLIVIPN